MLRALEAQFTDTNVSTNGEGRKRGTCLRVRSGISCRCRRKSSRPRYRHRDAEAFRPRHRGRRPLELAREDPGIGATVEGRPPRDRPRGPARGAGAGHAAGPPPAHRSQDRCCHCRGHQGLPHPGGRVSVARRPSAAYAVAGTLRPAHGIATPPLARPKTIRPALSPLSWWKAYLRRQSASAPSCATPTSSLLQAFANRAFGVFQNELRRGRVALLTQSHPSRARASIPSDPGHGGSARPTSTGY